MRNKLKSAFIIFVFSLILFSLFNEVKNIIIKNYKTNYTYEVNIENKTDLDNFKKNK